MPSYLDFDTTNTFRNFILGKTLTVPNGPQTFTAANYTDQTTRDMSNVDSGAVDANRTNDLLQSQTSNVYKPLAYDVTDYIDTIPRKANLSLYPYFVGGQDHTLISIINNQSYTDESELFKFAAWNIGTNPDGPFFARIAQNLYTSTVGQVNLIDALQGNTSTAINIITGREPLIQKNEKITVDPSLLGKGIDFLETVAGVEFPYSQIPGDYLSNPNNPSINYRPTASTEAGKIFQDTTGALGSLIGIERRPTITRKPSDLFIEYMGSGPKSTLFDNLSYSKYIPDYTTSAMSQNTSKLFNFVDQFAQGFKNFLGLEAPKGKAYIGDDRGNNVTDAMTDFNSRMVRSSYYLSLMFDPIQTTLFLRTKNISEGGAISSKLTWISSKSKNKLGVNNDQYTSEQIQSSLSTNFAFRDDSILGSTQKILETMPTDGGASRSHVANVIDQTSRVFREDDVMISRGSAIKYTNKFSGTESGIEYCRVWTKDRSYMNYSDTMKKTTLLRKFGSSVLSTPWNLNIYPNSNGNGGFDNSSSNMSKGMGDGFYAKKYMFSFENLAWKTSNSPGFTYNDLPYCERGPNGGRVMWFPPYDLKVTEQNSAKWESNVFLGRPEPVYTYQNTERTGTISFKVIVDHPSILNLLVQDHFKNMPDEEADNYINAFFAGCEDMDFYGLIRKYTTLTQDDITKIQAYLNGNKDTNTITKYQTVIAPIANTPTPQNGTNSVEVPIVLYYQNDSPDPGTTGLKSSSNYSDLYTNYKNYKSSYINTLVTGLNEISVPGWTSDQMTDYKALSGNAPLTRPTDDVFMAQINKAQSDINTGFNNLDSYYNTFKDTLSTLKDGLTKGTVQNISLRLGSRTSSIADAGYNMDLSYRRSHSVIREIFTKISATDADAQSLINGFTWSPPTSAVQSTEPPKTFKLGSGGLGYQGNDGTFVIEYVQNTGEQPRGSLASGTSNVDCSDKNTIVNAKLKTTLPITFWCRESDLKISYETKDPDQPAASTIQPAAKSVLVSNTPTGVKTTPPIDEMKSIIMKTLSECYYFKKLEEESPIQFSSLKEKLRYFHPAFHSMTPEGLNARLTFLHQCIRPGETIPIKGISDVSDLNARNTTFGPPPICVMRIGDFYHSKIAIKDVNIDFEQNLWDLNPEGIGVQPMIADVTLQVNFIGGHGMAKPVERLQNALSSNFYANTEIYDPRSISTETTIAGEDASKFTKEFLQTLVKDNAAKINTTSQAPTSTDGNITQGYIGVIGGNGDNIAYTDLVGKVFTATNAYFEQYKSTYNNIIPAYNLKISSMLLSPTYRTIKNYTIQTGTVSDTIELLGAYPKNGELSVLVNDFKSKILDAITNNSITTIFGFSKDMTPSIQVASERVLKPYVSTTIGTILDNLVQNTDITSLEKSRNTLIQTLDGLNFILETGYDGKIDKTNYIGVQLTGYTSDMLYPFYSDNISFIKNQQHLFTDDLDLSYVFNRNTIMTTNDLSYFLSVLLINNNTAILNLYSGSPNVFSNALTTNIEKRLNNFLAETPAVTTFKNLPSYPTPRNDNPIQFNITSESNPFTNVQVMELTAVHNTSPNITTNVLNYYR
jgi:hypothetical protein